MGLSNQTAITGRLTSTERATRPPKISSACARCVPRHSRHESLSGDISVFFSEKPEPRVKIAVGNLKQAGRAAAALVNDPVTLRQGEDVAFAPANGVAADLAL